ncbi:MAG: heme A synthase [Balneolaceae bacterium]|nr:MAG: heme A synthase [Balneolaceae bacterium]
MTNSDKKLIRRWYWAGATLVFIILIIGGITRLTGSGLSMTEWQPIMGVIPPLNEAQWEEAFEQYKQYPEYQQINRGMGMAEFKVIFFWEYLHRMAARTLGIVFIVPFLWFLSRRIFDKKQFLRAVFLMTLGMGQALMGWYMVQSGLADIPAVSHYRLAAHLSLAFVIFGACVWFALDLRPYKHSPGSGRKELIKWLWLFTLLLAVQIVWGAFVAGLNAGHIYNTFPKMFQYWFPPELWISEPLLINLVDNIVTVQWVHRVVGTLLAINVLAIWIRSYQLKTTITTKMWSLSLFAVVLIQYTIGVFTLIYHVPISLGVIHQAAAMILFGVLLGYLHFLKKA